MQGIPENPSLPNGTLLADPRHRLPRFCTRTILLREQGGNVVYKTAITEEARAFLEVITVRERENARYLQGQFNVLCGSLRDEGILYEYLPRPSLAQSIGLELGSGHGDRADKLLGLYVRRIRALEHSRCCPSEFLRVIAGEKPEDGDLCVESLSRALLDLTPRNILVDGDRWVVIDNEWSFSFPIPIVFLLFRAIRELCLMQQREIRGTTGAGRPAVGLLTKGLWTCYFPKHWIEYCKDAQISFSRMLRWEAGFRRFVAGSEYDSPGHVSIWHRETTRLKSLPTEDHAGILTVARRVLRRSPGTKRTVRFVERQLLKWQK
jgi:hypothetical protein